jgi:CubicO group peptidase (beta-lactamase class C family)
MRHTCVALFSALASVVACSQAPVPEAKPRAPGTRAELQQRIERVLHDTKTPGVGIAIVRRDGPEWVAGIGLADVAARRPVSADTLFRIGSVSKSFVALSVLKLQQEGRLSLNDTVRSRAPDVAFSNPWEATDPVRLVHVLEHTAGFDDLALCEYANNDPKPLTLAEGLAFHPASRTSRWRPGTRVSYSNSGPAVAAYVVEKVSGKRFEDYVAEQWFRPIGMTTASYFLTPDVARSLATLYHEDGATPFPYWHILLRPAGSINASARDMANYVQFYLNRGAAGGVALLPPEAIDRMERPESALSVREGIAAGYGLNNAVSVQDGFVFHGHNGGVDGGLTELAYLPGAGVGYVFMINTANGRAFSEIGKLVRAYVTRGMEKPAPPPAGPGPSIELAREYSGWYEPINPRNEILHFAERIAGLARVQVEGGKATMRPVLDAPQVFVSSGGRLFRPDNGPMPTMVLAADRSEGTLIITGRATFRQLPGWLAWSEIVVVTLAAVFSATSVLFALVWIPRKLFRRMRGVPHLAVRVLPLGAVMTVVAAAGLLVSGEDTMLRFGHLTPWSAVFFAGTILFPLLAAWGLVEAVRRRRAPIHRLVWWHSFVASLLLTCVAAYLAYWGVVGWRTWS